MKTLTKQKWTAGDIFAVPLSDGSSIIGQVLAHEPEAMNSVACAFFDAPPDADAATTTDPLNAFSVLLVTRDALDKGGWKIIGHESVSLPRAKFPHESLRPKGFVGAKVVGSGIVAKFLHAFRGLSPWDAMADQDYFDNLLTDSAKRPARLVLSR